MSRSIGLLAVAALAAAAAGCSSLPTDGRSSLASASGPGAGSTLAFESIDGPPPEIFRKLVANLNDEASTRQIAVVSRTGPATYRVRGYVSALVERNKTTFAWVWDVYDTDKRRTLRIAGEEPAIASRRRDAWAAADEQVLRHMARDGMERIATFLNSSAPASTAEPSLVTLVSGGRDDTPEAAGIFRVFRLQDQPAVSATPEAAADQPPPDAAKPPEPAKPRAKTRTGSEAHNRAKPHAAPGTQATLAEAANLRATDR